MKDETKLSTNKQKKQVVIADFSDKVGKAKAMVFTGYQGMTHHQLEDLKRAVRKVDAEFVITKNRLLARAVPEDKLSGDYELQGPTATLFAYSDVVSPLKELTKAFKALKLPVIKFGIFDGAMLSEADVIKLSTLPSREVLLAQIVGGLKSPIFSLHRALNWNIQKLVVTLKAVESKKQQ